MWLSKRLGFFCDILWKIMNEPFAQPNIFKAPQEERRASEYKCGRDLSGVWSRRSSESQASCLKPLSHCHHHDPPHSPHCDPPRIPTTTSMSSMKISRRRLILSKSIVLLVGGCRCQFISSLSKHLLSAYFLPNTELDAGYEAKNQNGTLGEK